MNSLKIVFLTIISTVVLASASFAQCIPCEECPQSRTDNIPVCNVADASDQYLTGYLQALIDMHYYEFEVQVIVQNKVAYLYHLPNNQLLSRSIICFVGDVPCIDDVQVMCEEPLLCCEAPLCENAVCEGEEGSAECCYQPYSPCSPCSQIDGIWFPQSTVLFAPLIADPRQVTNSASLRFNDRVISNHVGAVSFGDDFGIFRWRNVGYFSGDLDLDIEAGIFSVFNLDDIEASLVNTDFFVALMFAYAYDAWSWRFRLWHLSSHLGDEFLLANPGFDRCNLSDEGVDLFASYQFSPYIRLYAGIGDIFARDKSFPEHPLYFEFGSEIRAFGCRDNFNRLYAQPFFAMHFRSWQEHDFDFDQNYALGMEWRKIQGVGRCIRFFGEYHNGFSKEGQFVRKRTNYFALKLTYGY